MKKFKPSELCFYIGKDSEAANVVAIAPVDDLHYDQDIWIKRFDPLFKKCGFAPLTETVFEFDCEPEIMKKELLKIGLVENDHFSKMMEEMMPKTEEVDKSEKEEHSKCEDESCNECDDQEHKCDDSCEHDTTSEAQKKAKLLNEKIEDYFKDSFYEFDEKYKGFIPKKFSDAEKKDNYKLYLDKVNSLVEEVLKINLSKARELLSSFLSENVSTLAESIEYVAENNDFSKFHDTQKTKEKALLSVVDKPEHWEYYSVVGIQDLNTLNFKSKFINDGNDLIGSVVISDSGEITHHFIQKSD